MEVLGCAQHLARLGRDWSIAISAKLATEHGNRHPQINHRQSADGAGVPVRPADEAVATKYQAPPKAEPA